MSDVTQLFYCSNRDKDFSEEEIEKMLEKARTHNRSTKITGIMLLRSDIFVQLLEGPKENVLELYSKIKNDPRHKNLICLFNLDKRKRLFTDWDMSYKKMGEIEFKFVNEILSWNQMIKNSAQVDHDLILTMLDRFKKEYVV